MQAQTALTASIVSIYNLSLARLGGHQLGRINSPYEDSTEASLCNNLYPHIRDLSLSSYAWNFARKKETLAIVESSIVNAEYPFCFKLPADCLRPICLEGHNQDNQPTPFIIRERDLLTGSNPAVLEYIARIEDPNLWTMSFKNAVAWGLASELATALTNDINKQMRYLEFYHRSLADAFSSERNTEKPAKLPNPWLEAR
ncbi:hypothetical protein [Desulfovibrio litoralis]|uniref:Uncharacterized protein n=1 Tax=Desulfovibrio litoralis DSM 11393 TaxID=1121455 RepID=A0A1M7T808_9BACT|nr:hypothetical protein [Desulfovibrio litoralis]SHN66855.1 hypothetical protein SAMN02745728_01701 [Desulfovibrio litoralis DSM 11393]